MSGILEVDDPDADAGERRYSLPEGHNEALLHETSLHYIAPLAQAVVACTRPIDALLAAFRSGGGVPYADYGADLHEGQARFTRPMFENLLAADWFPAVADVRERLQADPPARVADVACGLGRSTLAIARAYPKVRVDGIDLDQASIDRAQELLPGSGVEDRVTFHHADAAEQNFSETYDLVTVFEALHDMSYPMEVLKSLRGLLAEGGSVIVQETVERYAKEAGFSGFEVLPIENDFWRFYRLSG